MSPKLEHNGDMPARAAQVFELDSAAVARILEAAANCAQDASPRGDSSDALLRVAREYGLVQGEREQAVRSEGAGAAAEGAAKERQEAALQVIARRVVCVRRQCAEMLVCI